jgi:hypothetical protein
MEPSSTSNQADHTLSHSNNPWGDPTLASWRLFFSQSEEVMPQKATNYQVGRHDCDWKPCSWDDGYSFMKPPLRMYMDPSSRA